MSWLDEPTMPWEEERALTRGKRDPGLPAVAYWRHAALTPHRRRILWNLVGRWMPMTVRPPGILARRPCGHWGWTTPPIPSRCEDCSAWPGSDEVD